MNTDSSLTICALDIIGFAKSNRRYLVWLVIGVATFSLLMAVKEVTSLLLLAYMVALLLDPILVRLARLGLSRSISIVLVGVGAIVALLCLVAMVVPLVIREYSHLIEVLPAYLKTITESLSVLLKRHFDITLELTTDEIWETLKSFLSVISVEQIKVAAKGLGETVLKGYSLTLTIVNAVLLPFFVYYIARDLNGLHSFVSHYLNDTVRKKVTNIGQEVLGYVYAFFEGQIIVSFIMAFGYAIGLSIVGLPSGVVVGMLAGFLNVVPYLGISIGLSLATIIALVNGFSFFQLLTVWAVFVIVQALEGTVLTPKIIGERVGIHPLVVMVALIIGGKLFGLLGLIMAIPAAAAVRVVLRHLLQNREEVNKEQEAPIALSPENHTTSQR